MGFRYCSQPTLVLLLCEASLLGRDSLHAPGAPRGALARTHLPGSQECMDLLHDGGPRANGRTEALDRARTHIADRPAGPRDRTSGRAPQSRSLGFRSRLRMSQHTTPRARIAAANAIACRASVSATSRTIIFRQHEAEHKFFFTARFQTATTTNALRRDCQATNERHS